jgi:general secretion pathway protein A
MYKAFFNLARNPFDLTPDPSCFVPTLRHNEALAALYYGIRQHKGFVVVTGEVGTGKTLLLRCLLGLLKESRDVAYAYIFNGRLSPTEFLQYIVSDFGLPASGKNKCELLMDLSRFLVSRGTKKMTSVVIVDEAHHLSADILEEIRLLTNLETSDDKLLQVVLVGQPELDEKLDSVELRQLKQRVAVRTQLSPLDAEETRKYVEQRMRIAGAGSNGARIFPETTVDEVFRFSQGIPRLINSICENALITAYARETRSVSPEIIKYVADEFRLGVVHPLKTETADLYNGAGVRRVINILLDLYANRRNEDKVNPVIGETEVAGMSSHEPNI